jgi:drug/metabolite transporter (DMT)-like permease
MSRFSPQTRAYAMLCLVMLLWAGNSIVGRAVRADIPPFTLAFGRWLGALLVLGPFVLRGVIAERAEIRRGWVPLLLLGLVGVAAFNGFLYSGLRHTTATNGLLMQATIPPLVLLSGRLLFRDRASLGQVIGVLLSTFGVLVIVFRGDIAAIARLRIGTGDLLILCGCLGWALYTVGLRRRPAVRPETFLFVTFVIGALAMAPLALHEALTGMTVTWSSRTFAAFAYVAVLPSVIAYFLYNTAVAEIGAGRAGQTISLMPIFGALLAAALLGEDLHPHHAAAMALILGGVAIAGRFGARPR